MATFSCGFKIVKYLLFVFNFFFWAAGAVLMAIGIWFLADGNALRWLHISTISTGDTLVRAASIIIVVVGAFIFIVGGLGCCGACREMPECLLTFATILMFLLLAQLVTGILAGVFYDKIVRNIKREMNETLQTKYGQLNASGETEAWNVLQTQMPCCGLQGPADWVGSWWYSTFSQDTEPSWPVPVTCCRLVTEDYRNPRPTNVSLCSAAASQLTSQTQTSNRTSNYLNTEGCEATFKAWVKAHLAIIIGVAIGLIGIQIIGIVLACCLGQQIRNVGTIA